MKRKFLSVLIVTLILFNLTGCFGILEIKKDKESDEDTTPVIDIFEDLDKETSENEETKTQEEILQEYKGEVYYLNYRPEADEAWRLLAKVYEEETGVKVTVVTAASGDYENLLIKEMSSKNMPTLFQVNGPIELEYWKDYCYDLNKSKVYKELTSDSYVLKDGKKVYGIGYALETYGIIVNKTLLKKAGYKISDIKSFSELKKVTEDITSRSEKLGFAAFTSAGMGVYSDWRFKTHLANLPIYFEYQKDGIESTEVIKGTYLDNYRDIFDLYINNSTCDGRDLSDKTVDDARNEFINEKAVFYQNGVWEYSLLSEHFNDSELAMIPIYMGVGDEANQGLCTGTERYWCVNSHAAAEDIEATLDFLYWVVTSDMGTESMYYDMGLVIPYEQAVESDNVFIQQDAQYTSKGKEPVTWTFTTMPSEAWKDGVGEALLNYAQNPTNKNWNKVEKAFVNGWREEWKSQKG